MNRVEVHIQTNMRQQGQSIKQVSPGKLFTQDKGWTLVYHEDLGDDHKVSSTVKVTNEMVVITRTGAVRMRQEYKLGQVTEGKYQSPYGVMQMQTTTEEIRWENQHLFLSYRLKLNDEDLGRYEIAMKMEGL